MPDEKNEPVTTPSDSEWGEDWESAFEAEEDFFFSEKGEITNFPLDDASSTSKSSPAGQAPISPDNLAGPDDKTVMAPQPNESASHQTQSLILGLQRCKTRIVAHYFTTRANFLALSLLKKISIVASMLIILASGLTLALFVIDTTDQPTGAVPTLPVVANEPPPSPLQKTAEKIRTKWQFDAFFIPVANSAKEQSPLFIDVSLTLLVLLDDGQEIPESKKPFIRDLIYQFFTNRPLPELQRYSLARGEMNQKLRDWIRKQWPQGDLETIIFNRYRIK